MAELTRNLRTALTQLLRREWTELYLITPRLGQDALAMILPLIARDGAAVRVVTDVSGAALAEGRVEPAAVQALAALPGCEVRTAPELVTSLIAPGPEGPALVSGAGLRLAELEANQAVGALLAEGAQAEAEALWAQARPVSARALESLVAQAAHHQRIKTIGEEIARVGAFVRVSVKGTRKSRRLDPRDYGVPESDWGRVVRPVEVALYKLDEVIKAREDLESVLAEKGLEWNGYHLVPRLFLDQDWPRLFANRERQLRERLQSPEGQASLKRQLADTRRELEAFFSELYPRAETQGMDGPTWVNVQVSAVLAETVTSSILEDSGLEYRVLTILPEDARSVEEVERLLQDPKLRSVQLTFHF